ncbi:HD domain-containing phosphohydrolase [Fervidibacillus halotolerans]|uniref:HD domain-containing protein n=1 Tax=Fervidibacillus halotolerans TaxID=2980027 RepID=A0A9E8M012_9BACI|nr:HD domain-containing phosphohydrolase [Fervidibacillus halotolerans]WAA12517.1 HD domain-containing protein [Fervidibacillus halotolerans]
MQQFKDFGVIFNEKGQVIEKVETGDMTIELLASYDGTEVIKHTLSKNTRWGIGPVEGWNGLEFIYILNGEAKLIINNQEIELHQGDNISALSIKDNCIIQSVNQLEFLYISSQPIFHHYSNIVKEIKNLSIIVEEKDGYTKNHCSRIMRYSMMIGEKLQLKLKDLHTLNIGSYLHDIGKVRIPDHILKKPGKLTDEEWEIIKKHPIYGKDILIDSGIPILKEAAVIVEQHHERYDGSGYPYGLKGDEIHIGAAIVAVVDSFDAMTTDRIYRKALSKEEAMEEIVRNSGTLYHPKVVQAFLSVIGGESAENKLFKGASRR